MKKYMVYDSRSNVCLSEFLAEDDYTAKLRAKKQFKGAREGSFRLFRVKTPIIRGNKEQRQHLRALAL